MMKKMLAGLVASMCALGAHAQIASVERSPIEQFLHGFYGGLSIGRGFGPTNFCHSDMPICDTQPTQDTFKLYGGVRLYDSLGLEFGWLGFGRADGLSGPDQVGLRRGLSRQTHAWVLNVAPSWALSANISAIGRVGLALVDTKQKDTYNQQELKSKNESRIQPYLGVALNYSLRDAISPNLVRALGGLSVNAGFDVTRSKGDGRQGWVRLLTIGAGLEF